MNEHPGFITFVDGVTGAVRTTVPVDHVPMQLRFAQTEQGPVPVVRVVASSTGVVRTIREYGPGGELLRSTVARVG
jgi:hypothetical protein